MKNKDLRKELESILKEAGEILLSYWGKQLERKRKREGFFTEADLASERHLMAKLTDLFPADFWAEESGQSGSNNNGYRWVIDPLDGTTNFACGLPYFCISVALTEHDVPIHAAIYNPLQDDFFYARQGAGAWCNGVQMSVSKPSVFAESVIAFGLAYAQDKRATIVVPTLEIVQSVQAARNFGAIALDLAYVAAGKLDGVFFSNLAWWDLAAGMLLVQEAGGIITDFQGKSLTPSYQTCVAGGALVHEHLSQFLSNH